MSKAKEFLRGKGAGFWFGVVTALLTLFSFANYLLAANDSYGYDGILIALYVVTLAADVVFLVKDFLDIGALLAGVLTGFLFGMFVKERFTYFATGLLGISQTGIAGGIMTALLSLLLIVFINIIGAFFMRDRKTRAEEKES